MIPRLEITAFAKSGGPLTKRIFLRDDGKAVSDGSACVMSRGLCRRIALDSVRDLASFIAELAPHQAISLGTLRPDLTGLLNVVPKAELNKLNGAAPPQTIARTTDYLGYRAGQPSLCLIDFDRKGMPATVAAKLAEMGGLWPALVKILPELKNLARVERASTSTGIFNSRSGEKFPD